MDIESAAQKIWDYMQLNMPVDKADVIFGLGSMDDRVAERAAQLYLDGFAQYLAFSGGISHTQDMLKTNWQESEAGHFASIAKSMGVAEGSLIIEDQATNTGENIKFTYELLKKINKLPRSMILVQKPYMERRTYATFLKQWPDQNTKISVTSPKIKFGGYFNQDNPKDVVLNIMVGDLQRIIEYPKKGFQIAQEVPEDVRAAMDYLIAVGYDKHLIA